jgi:hypothetical protein
MKNKTCGECKFYSYGNCNKIKDVLYLHNTNIACIAFESKNPTIFDRITASPEVLAPYFVRADFDEPFLPWFSTLTNESFETHEQAIAATVKKLKEVEK